MNESVNKPALWGGFLVTFGVNKEPVVAFQERKWAVDYINERVEPERYLVTNIWIQRDLA